MVQRYYLIIFTRTFKASLRLIEKLHHIYVVTNLEDRVLPNCFFKNMLSWQDGRFDSFEFGKRMQFSTVYRTGTFC